jgi:hypothetical protein
MTALPNISALIGVLHSTGDMVAVRINNNNGTWTAFVFDPTSPHVAIVNPVGACLLQGRGKTLNEALLNLDAVCVVDEVLA